MNNKPIKGAVLGSPIAHSLSPILHNKAYELIGLHGSYEAIEVASGALAKFLGERGAEFDYLSLTMPLKEEVFQIASQFNIAIDELAQRIQSVNTLIHENGSWRATSTDSSGFVKALANAGYDHFKSVLIMGAGGTARAVAGSLDEIADEVAIMGRSQRRNVALASCFSKLSPEFLAWDNHVDLQKFDLVVNTTPSGAADLVAESVPTEIGGLLFDVLYKPWPTLLARRWMDAGGKVIGGLELLLYQGIDQINLLQPLGSKKIDQDLRISLINAAN